MAPILVLLQTLIPKSHHLLRPSLLIPLRAKSTTTSPVEIDLADADLPRRLEDALHTIAVLQAAPSWLPFVPGSSYWVPPRGRRSKVKVVGVVGRDGGEMGGRGWPSARFFVEGLPLLPFEENLDKNNVKSDDEET